MIHVSNCFFLSLLASLFGDVFLRPDLHLIPSAKSGRNLRSVAKEEEMKRAAFVYHFLSNDLDDI
jgi:hypothetical protein